MKLWKTRRIYVNTSAPPYKGINDSPSPYTLFRSMKLQSTIFRQKDSGSTPSKKQDYLKLNDLSRNHIVECQYFFYAKHQANLWFTICSSSSLPYIGSADKRLGLYLAGESLFWPYLSVTTVISSRNLEHSICKAYILDRWCLIKPWKEVSEHGLMKVIRIGSWVWGDRKSSFKSREMQDYLH